MEHPLLKTFDQLVQRQIPNFFRLYLNPSVAQTCLCLGRMVRDAWYAEAEKKPVFQTFLANSFGEALSGALKLARFSAGLDQRAGTGLLIGDRGRLDHFVSLSLGELGRLELIPNLTVVDIEESAKAVLEQPQERFSHVVVLPGADVSVRACLQHLFRKNATPPLLIACVSRSEFDDYRREPSSWWPAAPPDIVVFDESFVHRHVPFGAFTATQTLYANWNRPGYTTFHSTTFQPNSVAALHFLRCLAEDDPNFMRGIAEELRRISDEPALCKRVFASQYSPSLAKTIGSLGFDVPDVTAAGHYVKVAGRRIFDGVAGIACSIRGHNPPSYVEEMARTAVPSDSRLELRQCLKSMTGLDEIIPAVSGASAVENALRLGLVAKFPRKHVLALKGGFGGKTLFALTGTAKASYKEGLEPLYESVVYVDPFAPDALEELSSTLEKYPVGVVQLELVQAVGGVRAVPEPVVRFLDQGRRRYDYALFIDEVQTGMYRTGPFIMSKGYGIVPDLLTLSKGTSDMMFPFAVALCSSALREQIAKRVSGLQESMSQQADYEFGHRTLLHTLQRAETAGLAKRVQEAGEYFAAGLKETLASCPAVRDIRVFGLLIAIELNTSGSFRKWFKKQVPFLYILNMLLHRSFPLLIGFCQYEPHVLKLTPPLSITQEEIAQVCATIGDVLNAPSYGLLPPAFGLLTRTYVKGKWNKLLQRDSAYEPAAR